MLPDPRVLLSDIDHACADIMEFTVDLDAEGYTNDSRTQAAVERKFEIIGEAVNSLLKSHPELAQRIPSYRQIINFRNLLIHGYSSVMPERVWSYASNQLTGLRQVVRVLLAELESARK